MPAHNEEKVIGRCLRRLTDGARDGEVEVIVVANACRDATAEIARRMGVPVRVAETPVASKAQSLNLGDRLARGKTRIYVDADVELSIDAVRQVAACLERGEALAAAPRMHIDLAHSSWAVRAYYRLWQLLPYFRQGVIGAGVYALSEVGRQRFGQFPEVFSEDEFVRLIMKPTERRMVESCEFTVRAPRTLRDLIRVRARWLGANRELHEKFPHLGRNEHRSYGPSLRMIARRPRLWLDVPVYVLVRLAAEVVVARRRLLGRRMQWTRDESVREPATKGSTRQVESRAG